jgi:hypothetical protein
VPDYSLIELDVLPFVVIPALLVAALAWGLDAASKRLGEGDRAGARAFAAILAGSLWMGGTWVAAGSGVLGRWEAVPPPFMVLIVGALGLACLMSFGGWGRRLAIGLPLWTLVAVQGFRLPLELAMHAMYERGIMPGQMSYTGRNFDILTGATALILAPFVRAGRSPRWLVVMWNVLGLALLGNIVAIAIVSTPRFHYFGADRVNVWVAYPPFVWLPAVMVPAALAGHLIIFRALGALRGQGQGLCPPQSMIPGGD